MLPFFLYLLTGIATGAQVWYLLSWAVWGAPTHPLQFLSLFGSLLLVVAAYLSLYTPKTARWVASVALLAIWPFYATAIVHTVRIELAQQKVRLQILKWTPDAGELRIVGEESLLNPGSGSELLRRLREIGLTGEIRSDSYSVYGSGPLAEVILVMNKQVDGPVILRQPKAGSVIYVQYDQGWRMYPPDAPTTAHQIEIRAMEDSPNQTSVMVELADGARQGTGVCCWPEARGKE